MNTQTDTTENNTTLAARVAMEIDGNEKSTEHRTDLAFLYSKRLSWM